MKKTEYCNTYNQASSLENTVTQYEASENQASSSSERSTTFNPIIPVNCVIGTDLDMSSGNQASSERSTTLNPVINVINPVIVIDISEVRSFLTDDDIIYRRSKAISLVMKNYYLFKSFNQSTNANQSNNTSNKFFITSKCGFDCKCYTRQDKPRIPIGMCLIKGELDLFQYAQPFQPKFYVEYKCDICKTEHNCNTHV